MVRCGPSGPNQHLVPPARLIHTEGNTGSKSFPSLSRERHSSKLKDCAIYLPHYSFEYLTPRIRITPNDLPSVNVSKPATLHFICSPSRAAEIVKEVKEVEGWSPITIYEPIPVNPFPSIGQTPATHLVLHRTVAFPRNSQHLNVSYPLFPSSGKCNQLIYFPQSLS